MARHGQYRENKYSTDQPYDNFSTHALIFPQLLPNYNKKIFGQDKRIPIEIFTVSKSLAGNDYRKYITKNATVEIVLPPTPLNFTLFTATRNFLGYKAV
jgi:hypothetical protein